MPSAFVQWMQQHQRPISYVDDSDRLGQARQRLGIKINTPAPTPPPSAPPATPPSLDDGMVLSGRDRAQYQNVPYADSFLEAEATYGVPANWLMGMAQQESNFNPQARSGAGAMGVMQFMPATWGEQNPNGDVWDPHQNIMTGAKYMRWLTDYFDGDIHRATLAYNGGVGNISRGFIPDESKLYLQKVTNYSQYY